MTITVFIMFGIGLVLIIKGGDYFVDAASFLAYVTGIPKFIIGATVVSIATTMPELTVSLLASLEGQKEIAVGNAVGSVACNIGVIMAVSLLFLSGKQAKHGLRTKSLLLIAAVLFLWAFGINSQLSFVESSLLLLIFLLFMLSNVRESKTGRQEERIRVRPERKESLLNVLKFVLGVAAIILGARLLVDNGTAIARIFFVPESIIALTLVAFGTSLPELATAITAIRKKESSLSVGNIFGANILDLTMILPVCAFADGGYLSIPPRTSKLDLPAVIIMSLTAVLPAIKNGGFRKWQGVVLLAEYGVYLAILVLV